MSSLALTVQDEYKVPRDSLNLVFRCILSEYVSGAQKPGVVIYEQSERGLETKYYHQEITSGAFNPCNYIIVGLELLNQHAITEEQFAQLVDAHYAGADLTVDDVSGLADFVETATGYVLDPESLLISLGEDSETPDGLDIFPIDYIHFWNDFLWWIQRKVLRLNLIALDCVGEGFSYGETNYFTSTKFHETIEDLMLSLFVAENCNDDFEIRGRKFQRQLNYEVKDWDFVTHRSNPIRGGGFTCFS